MEIALFPEGWYRKVSQFYPDGTPERSDRSFQKNLSDKEGDRFHRYSIGQKSDRALVAAGLS